MLSAVDSRWNACRRFVGRVCADRPASHGLPHMEDVAESAVAIACLEGVPPSSLPDIVLVAMLHDVNDHKYDPQGTLNTEINKFLSGAKADDGLELDEHTADQVLKAIGACSFSKEKKQGMRYFEKFLDPHWVQVRDIVSDADKLHALGMPGLMRCWEYGIETWDASKRGPVTHEGAMQHVAQHSDEKLLRLTDEYIVTASGKHLGRRRTQEMRLVLDQWARSLPVHLPLTMQH
jgi:HD superfamily phosphodiesterase